LIINDDPTWKAFKLFVEKGEKSQIPFSRFSSVFHFSPDDDTIQTRLGITGAFIPYCFLVHNGAIRWKDSGEGTKTQLSHLSSVTRKLEK